ncbi:hypothetical protein [Kribbella sp. NPDC003557]|uniref:hypothetical protein n=1 Tax=Kribbella sp. NPDC003557 TaxID=3154449 RepID=UPI0033B375BA
MSDAPAGELGPQHYRMMNFAVGVALLAALAPTWLTREFSDDLSLYSGIGLLGLSPEGKSPMEALGTCLFLAYILLALGFLLARPEKGAPVLLGVAGFVVTVVVLANRPSGSIRIHADWTGAPIVALGLWFISTVVSLVALRAARAGADRKADTTS